MTPLSFFSSLASFSPLFIHFCLLTIYLTTSCLLSYTYFLTSAQILIYPSAHLIFLFICPFSSLSITCTIHPAFPSILYLQPNIKATDWSSSAYHLFIMQSLHSALTSTNKPEDCCKPSTLSMAMVLPNYCIFLL